MTKGKIFILSGPSGSGKTTLYQRLLLSGRLKGKLVKSVSVTTRPRRLGERNGRDYLFISLKEFLKRKKAGYFLEWQKVFENYYGTPKAAVQKLLDAGKNVLLCIDVKGARVIRRLYPGAVTVFIKAPSWAVLRARLGSRRTENAQNLRLRLGVARGEMQEAEYYTHTVVNDNLATALKKLEFIISSEIKPKGGKE